MLGTQRAAWAIVAFCVLVLLLIPHRTLAQGDHRLVWRTLETEHFSIHYHEPLGVLARHLAGQAERIHAQVSSGLGLPVAQRVHIVLSDDDDAANGSATPLPYNVIRLRAVAPDDMSTLSDYDDWPTLLLTHEHAHILHLEQANGLPRLFQAIFGRSYTPQQSLPGWFVEGLATVVETEHTSAGRGRSTLFDMYLRMDALEGRLLGLDLMGFDGEPWPHGHVRYLYGQALLGFIARRYGERALGRFAEEYGRRIVPYGINRALRRVIGKTFVELYAEFTAELTAQAMAARDRVLERGLVEGTRLTFHGETTRSPRFLPSGEIAYMVSDERHVPELRIVAAQPGKKPERVVRVPSVGGISYTPGAARLIYATTGYHRGVYTYSELYGIGRGERRPTKLTQALRAREPDVSPDGRHVVYVTHGAGTSHLMLAELDDVAGTARVLVRSRELEQVFTPRFSPDGKYVAYSGFTRGGYRDIWLVEVATGTRTRLTYDRALDRNPVFSRDGRSLYFSSDRTGISNLYALELATGALRQITNVVGGAFQPDVSPDGRSLVYVGYTSRGFDLFVVDIGEGFPAPPSYERPPQRPLLPPLVQASTSYQPLRTLWPRAWSFATEDVGNGQQLTLQTDGRDAVGFHAWSAQLTVNLEREDRTLELAYSYARPRFPVHVSAYVRDAERTTGLVVNGANQPWDSRFYRFTLGSRYAFPWALRRLTLRTDYVLSSLEARDRLVREVDPNYRPPSLPTTGFDARVNASLQFATVQRRAYDISRSWGYVFDFGTTYREPLLGSRERDVSLSLRYEQFFRFAFRESVLALAYNAAWNASVAIGGTPARVGPILDYLTGSRGSPTDYARLRGYEERTGEHMHVVQLEYRFLLTRINRGPQTLPVFARRLHGALFTDVGDAYTGALDVTRFGVGVGGELRFDWAADYGQNQMLRLGVARGVTEGGVWQFYASMTQVF